jgi:hypothetical protein
MSIRESRIKAMRFLSGVAVCCFFLAPGSIKGQTQTTPPSTSSPGGTTQTPPVSPTITSGSQLGDIFFQSRNSFIFSLNAAESYQDNAFYSGSQSQVPDYTTRATGRIAYHREQGRTTTGLDFTFGRLFYRRADSNSQYIADGGFDLSYRATPRWTIRLGDRTGLMPQNGNFLRRDSILDPLPPSQGPNNTVLLPLNQSLFNTIFFSSSYMVSRRSGISFSVNNTITRYDQTNLQNEVSYGASFGYNYRLSEKNTLDLTYGFNYFDSTGTQNSVGEGTISSANLVRNHMATIRISRRFTPSLSGSIGGGVLAMLTNSYNITNGQPYNPGARPIVTGNITFSPTFDPRTFFSMQAGQGTTNGAGLGAVSLVQSASLSIGRRMTKIITGSAEGGYARNQYLADIASNGNPTTLNGFFAQGSLSVHFTQRFDLSANYRRFQQLSTGFNNSIPGQMNGNIFTVSISYSFPWFY